MDTKSDRYPICGAIAKSTGKKCQNLAGKGTNHKGSGKCRFHGGSSTGAKTMAGKQKVAQNPSTHGLYGTVLRGKDLARLKTVRNFSNGAIIQSSFEMVSAKLLGAVEGDVRIPQRFTKIYGVAEVLFEQGELEEDDLLELKIRLSGIDLEKIARISLSAASLASAASAQSDAGDIAAQNSILRSFVIEVLRNSSDPIARTLAVQTISRLKLDAGLPVEELDALIHIEEQNNEQFDEDNATARGEFPEIDEVNADWDCSSPSTVDREADHNDI